MTVAKLLSAWRADPEIAGNVEAWQTIPARPAQFAPLPEGLHPSLVNILAQAGIKRLYTHQAAAWELAEAGKNVVVVTGTASGKTLCYNLPVLDRLLRNPESRALYLFPTKALAQDQASMLRALLNSQPQGMPGALAKSIFPFPVAQNLSSPANPREELQAAPNPIPVGVYDGDTPQGARPSVRKQARIVISNPDMLHAGILPHHTSWMDFFSNLKFVVIDEMHSYRGVFGSHIANVLRRLQRIARFYGATPQFILTSATIANPVELAGRLIEQPVTLVDQDGSGRGSKSFLIYNPPLVDPDLGLRRSSLQESVRLAEDLLAYNVQTIIFARSRRSVELVLTYLRQRPLAPLAYSGAPETELDELEIVRGYRSGYLPKQRREIERGLRAGKVRAVVATNALELGIDIGGMGASLLVGYPGTVAATWQQAGRAGRGAAASMAVLIATADPLDQFLAGHPDYFFGRSPEQALINADNLLILLNHLRCAAFELPFNAGECFGSVPSSQVNEFLAFLAEQGSLHQSGDRFFWMADQYPAQAVSLRSASPERVLLQVVEADSAFTLGEVDTASACWMVHPEAIYLHEGQSFLVDELDLEQKIARLRPVEMDYYTQPRSETTVALLEKLNEALIAGGTKAYGEISVTTQLTGFRKVRWYTHEQLGTGELTLPPTELQTTGYWLSLDEQTVEVLRQQGLWSNDPNDYGPNWRQQRELARQRDRYRCQVCGIEETDRAHHVHHKTPFRLFASYEQANQLNNLITVCPSCHRRIETTVRVRSGLAGLSFVLGQLAPFFLMCDGRDIGVHSDPQSPLAGGQPAVILYDQVPAGIGFSQRLFELHAELVQRALELVKACKCSQGCPSCIGPGGENGLGGKREALAILNSLAGGRLAAA